MDNTQSEILAHKYMKFIENKFILYSTYVIGKGSFGKVVYGRALNGMDICFKLEKSSDHKTSILKEELKIYLQIKGFGVPRVFSCGNYKSNRYIVMELMGPSLDKLFNLCNKKFKVETSIYLGLEMINRIEHVHSKGIIHRDIKPNNFLFGRFTKEMNSNDSTVYIIDFGLSASYIEPIESEDQNKNNDNQALGHNTSYYPSKFNKLTNANSNQSSKIIEFLFGDKKQLGKSMPVANTNLVSNDLNFLAQANGNSLNKFKENYGNNRPQPTVKVDVKNTNEFIIVKQNADTDKFNNFCIPKSVNAISQIQSKDAKKAPIGEPHCQHVPYKEGSRFVGTPRYASLNTHEGIRQSRRDDLESIAYIMIYFIVGDLPWQGVKAKTKSEKKERIRQLKSVLNVDTEPMLENLPFEIKAFLKACRSMKFYDTPDYDGLRNLLISLRSRLGYPDVPAFFEWDDVLMEGPYSTMKKSFKTLYEGYPSVQFSTYLEIIENKKNKAKNSIPSISLLESADQSIFEATTNSDTIFKPRAVFSGQDNEMNLVSLTDNVKEVSTLHKVNVQIKEKNLVEKVSNISQNERKHSSNIFRVSHSPQANEPTISNVDVIEDTKLLGKKCNQSPPPNVVFNEKAYSNPIMYTDKLKFRIYKSPEDREDLEMPDISERKRLKSEES